MIEIVYPTAHSTSGILGIRLTLREIRFPLMMLSI
jgi:hypothetical protein